MPDEANVSPRVRLALLIDADNVRATFLPIIIREASALGTVTVKRVYGHFASTAMNAWQPLVHEYALSPIHIPPAATGKNATDMKLAIEAMDLLHRGQVEGFCIVSSDSDFTTLASRIREDGVSVYGFGEEKASTAYVRSCDRFFYCDLLMQEEKGDAAAAPAGHARLPVDDILTAIEDVSGEDGWANLGARQHPHQKAARLRSPQPRLQEAQRPHRKPEVGRGPTQERRKRRDSRGQSQAAVIS